MTMSLPRLLEGIVATLRADVIPNVADGYARGQAVGVIDLLNNLGPRLDWAREPILQAVAAKAELLRQVGDLLPIAQPSAVGAPRSEMSTGDLLALRDRLDGELCDALALIGVAPAERTAAASALALIRAHMHDELLREMKLTRKPLFAEIATGRDGETVT